MATVGVDELAMRLAHPDAIRMVPPFLTAQSKIIARPSRRGRRYVCGNADIHNSSVAGRGANRRATAVGIGARYPTRFAIGPSSSE